MTRPRLKLSIAVIIVVSAFLLTSNIGAVIKLCDEWQEKRQQARETASLRQSLLKTYEVEIAQSTDGARRDLLELEYRFFKHVYSHQEVSSIYDPSRPIDRFGAFVIAKAYHSNLIAVSGGIFAPVERDHFWDVPIEIGCRPGRPATIQIAVKTRTVSCEDAAAVHDIALLLRNYDAQMSKAPML